MNLIFACNDVTLTKIQPREADIIVYPEIIDFGHLTSGQETGSDTFAVINAGDKVLTIDIPNLIAGNNRFILEDDLESTYQLDPGDVIDFNVFYTPETYESNGALIEVYSDDEDEPVKNVLVQGFGDAPVMSVTPENFDYGTISMGCDNEERITIRNDGNL